MANDLIFDKLKQYIVADLLEGEDVGLTATTPLLELGIINSLELQNLLVFIEQTFVIQIPNGQISAAHLQNLDAMVQMVKNRIPGAHGIHHFHL